MREMSILFLVLANAAQPASPTDAAATTAEEAVEAHRQRLMGRSAARGRCAPASAPDEIVVCAPDDDRYRVPPSQPEPESGVIAGVRQNRSAFEESACTHRCMPQPQIDVIGAINTIRRGIGRLLDPDS